MSAPLSRRKFIALGGAALSFLISTRVARLPVCSDKATSNTAPFPTIKLERV